MSTLDTERHSQERMLLKSLTPTEQAVAILLAEGMRNREIADIRVISINTVNKHVQSIFDKLGVHSRNAIIAMLFRNGWFS